MIFSVMSYGQETTYPDPDGFGNWKGQLVDNTHQGKWTRFYPTGEKYVVLNYVDNKVNGKSTAYYKSGKVKSTCFFQMGVINGLQTLFDSNGVITSSTEYLNGNYHGMIIIYKNGKKKSEREYKEGMANGVAKDYNDKGNLILEFRIEDKQVKNIRCWDDNGTKLSDCAGFGLSY